MIQNKRVHILNLGFQSDWIIKSFVDTRPDKIYLFRKAEEPKQVAVAEKEIKKFSKKFNIEVEIVKVDGDLYDLIKVLKKIILIEAKNFIHLGISSGNRDSLSAFILSSMIFKKDAKEIILYSIKEGDFLELPNLEVKLPKKEVLEVLKFIQESKGCKKKDLRDYVFGEKILEVSKKSKFKGHNQYIKLNRAILDPALEWKLIEIEGKRKGCKIHITEEGKKWSRIFN